MRSTRIGLFPFVVLPAMYEKTREKKNKKTILRGLSRASAAAHGRRETRGEHGCTDGTAAATGKVSVALPPTAGAHAHTHTRTRPVVGLACGGGCRGRARSDFLIAI